MKLRRRHIFAPVLFLLILSLFGCQKKFETGLIGTWYLDDLGSDAAYLQTSWTFNSDASVEITDYYGNTVTGEYDLDTRWVVQPILKITMPNSDWRAGNYKINTLSNNILKITRYECYDEETGEITTSAAYMRAEFYK